MLLLLKPPQPRWQLGEQHSPSSAYDVGSNYSSSSLSALTLKITSVENPNAILAFQVVVL